MPDIKSLYAWLPTRRLTTSRRLLSLLAAAAVSIRVLLSFTWHHPQQSLFNTLPPFQASPSCRELPGASNILVVMRTGATEIADKLSIHLRTTFTCYPHLALFSDFSEDLPTGHHLYDAFTYTPPSIKETHSDFTLYRKLQTQGRLGLSPYELSGPNSHAKSEVQRKRIPGWKLDKWKFLPMTNQTLHLYPEKQWYVFVEADTYLVWSNFLHYVGTLSWKEDHYIGSRAVIAELGFAHGGSGFLLSRPALQKVVTLFNAHREEWEAFDGPAMMQGEYWVGDHILAAALREAGVLLENGDPSWQSNPVNWLDLRPNGGLWCSTAMTFHHQSPAEIEELWKLEQDWVSEQSAFKPLIHRDLFERYVLPRIKPSISNWDNRASLPRIHGTSLQECEAICAQDASCMQYTFDKYGGCRITSKLMLGDAAEGITSGWMIDRIVDLLNDPVQC